jgi:hypothetical protein
MAWKLATAGMSHLSEYYSAQLDATVGLTVKFSGLQGFAHHFATKGC